MLFQKTIISFICLGLLSIQAQNKKHDILVSSASIQTLYHDCANFINISVPDLCSNYNPVCTATGADIQQSKENSHKFRIVPQGKTCTLSVSNNINDKLEPIGDISFKVIDPPKPTIDIKINGQRITSNTIVRKGSKVTISIVPNNNFAISSPNDARYGGTKITFFKLIPCGGPAQIGTFDLNKFDLVKGVNIAIPLSGFEGNDLRQVFVEISEIYRINFKGEKIIDNRFTLYERSSSLQTEF